MGYADDPEVQNLYNSKSHRRVPGARGARFASLKSNAFVFVGSFAFVALLMRYDDSPIYHIPAPPVPAPPPTAKALSYVMTSEMPHLKKIELEQAPPKHIPKKEYFLEGVRQFTK